MLIKKDFTIQKVGASYLAVPVGETSKHFHGMIRLNETGAFLWQLLTADTTRDALIDAMTKEYDIDAETAAKDIDIFITSLKEHSILED